MANQFEAAARAKKVRNMVIYFDQMFAHLSKIDPTAKDVDPFLEASRVADALRAFTDEHWKLHAVLAGQRPPKGEETKRDIIAVYEGRAFEAANVVGGKRIGVLH